MLETNYLYACKHCKKRFLKEKPFMAHECKEMRRSYEVQTMVGQQAYQLYKCWLEKQRRKPPPIEGFVTSTYYTAFYRFAQSCRDTGIADPELYVDLMVKRGISPALWSRPDCYQLYIEHIDKRSDPYDQAEQTIEQLQTIAAKLNVPVSSVFKTLQYGEVLLLLNQRRLSPWILFCSPTFKEWTSKLTEHDRTNLMKAIGVGYWAMRLEKSPEVVKDMKQLTEAVGL